jgi:hypothetical protein
MGTLHGVVRLGIPFDPVLWVLKSSVPVSRKIQLGMPNVPGFSKSQKHVSNTEHQHFDFPTV